MVGRWVGGWLSGYVRVCVDDGSGLVGVSDEYWVERCQWVGR